MSNLPALKKMAETDAFKGRIAKLMNSDTYVESLISLVGANKKLMECDPASVMKSALIAASLRLPINPALGYVWIVPYGKTATFQMSYKGLIQLALRSKNYKHIHGCEIYKDEYLGFSPLTGEVKIKEDAGIDGDRANGGEVYGYYARFETHDGFISQAFMTKDQTEKHAAKYSQAYKYDKSSGKKLSPWSLNFDDMSIKTVLKKIFSKYGQLTPELATALEAEAEVPTVQEAETGKKIAAPSKAREVKAEVVEAPIPEPVKETPKKETPKKATPKTQVVKKPEEPKVVTPVDTEPPAAMNEQDLDELFG